MLILVGASGFSYEEAAEVCNCRVGTVKSRVARARSELLHLLTGDNLKSARINSAPIAGLDPSAVLEPVATTSK